MQCATRRGDAAACPPKPLLQHAAAAGVDDHAPLHRRRAAGPPREAHEVHREECGVIITQGRGAALLPSCTREDILCLRKTDAHGDELQGSDLLAMGTCFAKIRTAARSTSRSRAWITSRNTLCTRCGSRHYPGELVLYIIMLPNKDWGGSGSRCRSPFGGVLVFNLRGRAARLRNISAADGRVQDLDPTRRSLSCTRRTSASVRCS